MLSFIPWPKNNKIVSVVSSEIDDDSARRGVSQKSCLIEEKNNCNLMMPYHPEVYNGISLDRKDLALTLGARVF